MWTSSLPLSWKQNLTTKRKQSRRGNGVRANFGSQEASKKNEKITVPPVLVGTLPPPSKDDVGKIAPPRLCRCRSETIGEDDSGGRVIQRAKSDLGSINLNHKTQITKANLVVDESRQNYR